MSRLFPAIAITLLLCTAASAAAPPLTSTIADQSGVALTVYNANLALVKDRRTIPLERGPGELRFADVASQLIPSSVQIRSLDEPGSLRVLEQNYEYDLLTREKLLDKYVGKEVQLYRQNPYTEREELVTATLLANNGGPVFRIGDQITYDHPGRIIFPGVPSDLMARPTLVWLLENDRPRPQSLETTYLTGGIGWRADYVLTLGVRDDAADLAGWVTVDNRSGATYRNAQLKLVAGTVNRVQDEGVVRRKLLMEAAAAPAFQEEGLFEYHLYTLERPTTVRDNQSKQIALLQAAGVPVKKELVLRGEERYFYGAFPGSEEQRRPSVYLELNNSAAHGLGMPLPKGVMRVYKEDGSGSAQFVGEDAIDHTPANETFRIRVGESFDVVARRRQTEWKKLAGDTHEAAFEIVIRNHRKEAVALRVQEPVSGDWQMLASSHPWKKTDAFGVEFPLTIASEGSVTLTYRLRMRH
jgi:hypothetical protein